MGRRERLVIVGAGHAGGRAALRLREAGYGGQILLVGEESEPPYERPLLSKEAVASDTVEPTRDVLCEPSHYVDQEIELLTDKRITALDLRQKRLRTGRKWELDYDRLLLTTGAAVRRLEIPGARLDGVCYLRTAADARALRPRLTPGSRIIVVGGGFIGLEVAAAAAARECNVCVLEAAPRVLGRLVCSEVAEFVSRLHRSRGVMIQTAASVAAIRGDRQVRQVVLDSGAVMPADTVVVGVGVRPADDLAREAGIVCPDGIQTDEYGRTSQPEIFAAGDVASAWNPFYGRHVRLESWDNAQRQAVAVADNIAGVTTPYGGVPWFWTDQYDMNLQVLGAERAWDQSITRGDRESASFVTLYLRERRIVGAALVNRGRDRRPLKRLIENGTVVDPAEIADESIPLKKILGASPGGDTPVRQRANNTNTGHTSDASR